MNDFVVARILPAAAQGMIALAVAFALTRILRKLPADSQAWIWRLAIGRFLLALFWEWPVAVLPGVNGAAPKLPVHTAVKLTEHIRSVPNPVPITLANSHPIGGVGLSESSIQTAATGSDWTPVTWVWAVGTMVVLGFGLCRWLQLFRLSRRGNEVSTRVRVSDEAAVPFLVGSVIVLPSQMAPESRDVALAHEMAHRIRRDPLYSLPNFAVSALFWFVLPVWLALREYAIQVEIDCDRRALRLAGVSPRHYGSMLVALATGSHPPVGASAMAGGPTALSRRLKAMKNHQNPRNLATIALTLAVGALVLTPVRPVAAALPRVQSAEVKQSQAKVERAQRDLNRALAELNQAVKRTSTKRTSPVVYNLSVQRAGTPPRMQSLHVVGSGIAVAPPVMVEGRELPVEVSIAKANQLADMNRVKALVDSTDRQVALQDHQRQLTARNLQMRIQRLEEELNRLKLDLPPMSEAPAKMSSNLHEVPVSYGMAVTTTVADATAAEARAGMVTEVRTLPEAGAIADYTSAKAAAGSSDARAMKQDVLKTAPAVMDFSVAKTGESGLAEAAPAMAAMAAVDVRRAQTFVVPKPASRNLQFAAGKNGTITVIEDGKVRTVRVNPKTHTVVVDGFTIYMDGKRTPDGSLIIRVSGR